MKVGIELSKATTILKQLQRRGKWTGRANGATVRMWKRSTEDGIRVFYQCHPKKGISVTGSAVRVSEAIQQCNQSLGGPQIQKPYSAAPTPPMTLSVPAARQEWLPYKDAEL